MHTSIQIRSIAIIILILLLGSAFAGQEAKDSAFSVSMDFNDADGMLYGERVIQTFVDIQNHSAEKLSLEIEWKIETDDWRPLKQVTVDFEVKPDGKRRAYCPWFEFPGPGFFHITAEITGEDGKIHTASRAIGIDPEKIHVGTDAEKDFDAFWERSLSELKKIDPKFNVIPQKRDKSSKTKLYKVEMQSWEGVTVRGWLEVPKKRGKYPALLRVPGYGSNKKPIDKYDDLIVFSFNIRSHGDSDPGKEADTDMWIRGLHSADEYYYRGAYLDCIRAVDFLASRKDVDQDRIAVWGGSQGGGLSFATAALDPRIDLCISDIPWLTDWDNFFAMTHWSEIGDWFAEHPEQNWDTMLSTLSYFDTKNMAERITCPVHMSVSLQDPICPPSTCFRTYNLIESPKEYTIHRDSGHWQPKSHWDEKFKWLRQKFEMD